MREALGKTVKITSARGGGGERRGEGVVEPSVSVTDNIPFQDCYHSDDLAMRSNRDRVRLSCPAV